MEALQSLGDQGVLARFRDEASALRWARAVREQGFTWLLDVVLAYSTVAVFHDADQVPLALVLEQLASLQAPAPAAEPSGALHVIPCCYEMQLDLDRIAAHTGCTPEEVIRLHTQTIYTIYAIGFCPGFPYLGYLPPLLRGVPRLEAPRLRVEQGSVGLTGNQTGIYTEPRPGGWNIIGRTPLLLVGVPDNYFPLRTGDRVRFDRIDLAEFHSRQGERL